MAQSSSFSSRTLSLAFRALRERGVLEGGQRCGIRAASAEKAAAVPLVQPFPARRHAERWREVRDRLVRDITGGHYSADAGLPGYKELCQHYGVSYRTMRRAVQALVDSGMLSLHRRRLRVAAPPVPAVRSTVAAVTHLGSIEELCSATPPRATDFWRTLSGVCSRANLNLAIYSCDRRSDGRLRDLSSGPLTSVTDLVTRRTVIGFIVWGIPSPILNRGLLTTLRRGNVPVVLAGTTVQVPRMGADGGDVRQILPSPGEGTEVGRFLIGLGHRRVAFVSPHHDFSWSRRRLRELQSVFACAGSAYRVLPFLDNVLPDNWRLPEHVLSSAAWRPHMRNLRSLERFLDESQGVSTRLIERHMAPYLRTRFVQAQCRGLYERALAERGVTAWVCVNDAVALGALEFLEAAGRKVPGEVSVVGFDDAPEAFAAGLTSYSFNVSSLAQAVPGRLLESRRRGARPGLTTILIPGFVVSRSSAGPCPGLPNEQ